jgi:hypothetical protein
MSIASDLARGRLRLDEERAAGQALRQAKQSLAGESHPHHVHASEETIRTDLLSYHCTYCHAFCLVVDRSLALLPHRSTDGAAVLVTADRHFRLRLDRGEVKAVRRPRGVEKQWRWKCRQCGLPVVYQCEDWQDAGAQRPPQAQLLYIVEGAVVSWEEMQAESTGGDAGEGAMQDGDERGASRGGAGRSAEEEELLREIEGLRQQPPSSTVSSSATECADGLVKPQANEGLR